jgi:hypothetical protein
VFESRVLKKLFGPKGDKGTVEWRKLRSEELYDLYFLSNIIQVIISRIMRLVGHVVHMGRGGEHAGCWCGNLREREYLKDLGLDGRIILKWMFKKWVWGHGLD